MGLQPVGKVPDLRRLAGRVASRSTVRWSWLGIHPFDRPARIAEPGSFQGHGADSATPQTRHP
jgi:hypothetical protein